ncbi:MAG: hypothetical protein M3281_00685 [Chloroflexota bacterium]|nr:hypothetical protein [Chloroflexota bacterium]
MRLVLGFVALNAFAGALSLMVFTTGTSATFFWTIAPPINAAMFGALYLAAGLAVAVAAIRGLWEPARYLAPMIPAFTGMMLVTTLLHLDRLDHGFELYYWIFIYVFAPLAGIFLYVSHERGGADWHVESSSVSGQLRVAAIVVGAATALFATVCFVLPSAVVRLWPWTISVLMVRVFASWLFAFAGALLWFAPERDWARLRPVGYMLLVTAVLLGLVLGIHSGDVNWSAWTAKAFIVAVVCIGVLGAAIARDRVGSSRRAIRA